MFTDKHYPAYLPRRDMDTYLTNGWYRMGQAMFTCQFLFMEKQLYSAIWTRLPLQNYSFRKSLRKILHRNGKRFKTIIRPFVLNNEKERLYQAYKKGFDGRLSSSLDAFLHANKKQNIYNTHETCVFDGDRLIAFSIFDLGESSIASIIGIYQPEYAKYSLGFYTMLLEIEYGMDRDFDYYYPGYIVPGFPRFDYKLRIGQSGEIEYLNRESRVWAPISSLKNEKVPVRILNRQLCKMQTALQQRSIGSEILYYPGYEANLFGYPKEPYLNAPVFVRCFAQQTAHLHHLIFYDLRKEVFVFCICQQLEDLTFYLHYSVQFDGPEKKHFLDILYKKEIIEQSPSVQAIAEKVRKVGRTIIFIPAK